MPIPTTKERVVALSKLRYYQNTCTASYSFAWKNWQVWEQEIDWMAMNGYNLPLAFTGQEIVWQQLWESYGVSASGLQEYFTGPAFLAWQRMSNIRAFGGPLSDSWIQQQAKLQASILQRYSELGITPVMPAFNGVVPAEMVTLYPSANITRMTPTWNSFPDQDCCNYVVSSSDPLFQEIGKAFLLLQEQIFGSYAMSHIYNCDTFNENQPASSDFEYLSSSSAAVYASMRAADDQAIWLMQAWLFVNAADFWTDSAIEYYLSGVPDDGMIILDLSSEDLPVWDKISNNNKQFIWCMLHNYGGRRGLYGDLGLLSTDPINTANTVPSFYLGTGLTMEAIDQNPVVYEFMSEMGFQTSAPDVQKWVDQYASRRYGLQAPGVKEGTRLVASAAWQALLKNNYMGESPVCHHYCQRQSIMTLMPLFNLTQVTRNPAGPLVDIWALFQQADPSTSSGSIDADHGAYRYDLVDVGRQVMSNLFLDLFSLLKAANDRADANSFASVGAVMLRLLADWDTLLNTHDSYLLGRWIADARSWAADETEADLFEYNARNQITLWGESGEINDYASKNWGGLAGGYYLPRWELFISTALSALKTGVPMDTEAYYSKAIKLGQDFCTDYKTVFPTSAVGSTVEVSKELQSRWGATYRSSEGYVPNVNFDMQGANLVETAMWTDNMKQLELLCDADKSCVAFTSTGMLKTFGGEMFASEGVTVYTKNKCSGGKC